MLAIIENKYKNLYSSDIKFDIHYKFIIELLYHHNGISALSYKWLKNNNHIRLYNRLVGTYKIKLELLSNELNIYDKWKEQRATLMCNERGVNRISSTYFDLKCDEIIKKYGFFPPAEYLRNNGYNCVINYLYKNNLKYEDIENKYNIIKNPKIISRNGMYWKSLAEASFANYLYARNIKFIYGMKYPDNYSIISGRKYGMYDIHFYGTIGKFKNIKIDVEIWGDNPYGHGEKEYNDKRKLKEKYNKIYNNEYFLGISYKDCYSEINLTNILEKYIGNIKPIIITGIYDNKFKSVEWSLVDDVIKQCKYILLNNNNKLPSEQWLRRRGKYKNRCVNEWENKYNLSSLCVYITKIGGIRKIRNILNIENKSTNTWSKDKIITFFKSIHKKYNKTPNSVLEILKNKKELTQDEKNIISKLKSTISSCRRYFKNGYREACELSNIKIRKIPKKIINMEDEAI